MGGGGTGVLKNKGQVDWWLEGTLGTVGGWTVGRGTGCFGDFRYEFLRCLPYPRRAYRPDS